MTQLEPDNSKRLGRHMLWVFWVLALAVLVWVFGNWEDRQLNPNTNLSAVAQSQAPAADQVLPDLVEVTLQPNRQHHFVAEGFINGKPVIFLLDTGATDVIVPKTFAGILKLKQGPAKKAQTANGVVTVYATDIKRLELGPIVLENVPASINPGMKGGQVLLGMSALRQLELSLQDGQMVLRQYRDPASNSSQAAPRP